MNCKVVFPCKVHSWSGDRFARFIYPKPICVFMEFPRDFDVPVVYVDRELIELMY
jgi:hypothetical protein